VERFVSKKFPNKKYEKKLLAVLGHHILVIYQMPLTLSDMIADGGHRRP
jgi:hypothetical protein